MFDLMPKECTDMERGPHERGSQPLECGGCLSYLNDCRVLLEPRESYLGMVEGSPAHGLDKGFNQKESVRLGGRYVHEMSLQEHFIFLKRLEALTAEISILYNQKIIKERISDESVVKRKASPAEFRAAVAQQKLDQRPKKEKKMLSDRDKAIQALLVIPGMTEAIATETVDRKFREQGKVVA